jgi:type IV fimbrial biogenesis protein FimT
MAPYRDRGFTLIELLAVITVLAVLLALGVPAFVNMIASQRVQTASADLYTSLLRARAEAIKQNADVTVAKAGSWGAGWTVSSVASGNLEEHGATKEITIAGPDSVIYRSNGRITGATPKFAFSSSSTATKRCVQVGLSGQPTVTKAACP